MPSRTHMGQLYYNVPCAQGVPGSVYVCIKILLRRFASADTIAWVVIRKDVAVDSSAKPNVEAAHLAQVDSISMGEKHRESGRIHTDIVNIYVILLYIKTCTAVEKIKRSIHIPRPLQIPGWWRVTSQTNLNFLYYYTSNTTDKSMHENCEWKTGLFH